MDAASTRYEGNCCAIRSGCARSIFARTLNQKTYFSVYCTVIADIPGDSSVSICRQICRIGHWKLPDKSSWSFSAFAKLQVAPRPPRCRSRVESRQTDPGRLHVIVQAVVAGPKSAHLYAEEVRCNRQGNGENGMHLADRAPVNSRLRPAN